MRAYYLWTSIAASISIFLEPVKSRTVFAHYMLGTVTEEHVHKDIDVRCYCDGSKSSGTICLKKYLTTLLLDGFALNIGDSTEDFVRPVLGYLFGYAQYRNFKLYISMDLYAAGDACYKKKTSCSNVTDYDDILTAWLGSSAYYRAGPNNFPMISTFSSGGLVNETFINWKKRFANQMYFVPDFDETEGYWDGAPEWYDYWGPIADGLFSWESAWPEFGETNVGDMSKDLKVMNAARAEGKDYMIGLSFLQYKNAYGTNVYRGGESNLPARIIGILQMSPRPEFVQFQTWNDGPEGHYIGNLWYEQNHDPQPSRYATQIGADHTGLQPIITSFIAAYKNGGTAQSMRPPGSEPVGALWYKTIFQDAICGQDGSPHKYFNKPEGFSAARDVVNWALVIPSNGAGWKVSVISGEVEIGSATLQAGFNYGSYPTTHTGAQVLIIRDGSGNEIAWTENQRCIAAGCPDGIYNYNPQVAPLVSGNKLSKRGPTLDCWSCLGTPEFDTVKAEVNGVTYGPIEDNSKCNDLKGVDLSGYMFQALGAQDQLTGWFDSDAHKDTHTWLSDFATPMGIGQSSGSCSVTQPCARPNCQDLNLSGDEVESAWKYVTVVSAINLNKFFFALYKGVEAGTADFSAKKTDYLIKFWPPNPSTHTFEKEFLNGISSLIGFSAALAGGPVAGGLAAGLAGVAGGVIIGLSSSETQIRDLAYMESLVSSWSTSLKRFYLDYNNALVQNNGYISKDTNIRVSADSLFRNGDWVNYKKIPVLSGEVSELDLEALYHNILAAQVVNVAWQKQGVYFSCYPMSLSQFATTPITDNADEPRLRNFMRISGDFGHGCYSQTIIKKGNAGGTTNENANPYGWGSLPDNSNEVSLKFDVRTAIESSWKSYTFGGLNASSKLYIDKFPAVLTNGGDLPTFLKSAGVFTIPICLVDSEKRSFEDFIGYLDDPGENGYTASFCDCFDAPDAFGVAFQDVYPVAKSMYKEMCMSMLCEYNEGPTDETGSYDCPWN